MTSWAHWTDQLKAESEKAGTIFSSVDPATVPYRIGQKVNVYPDAGVFDGESYTAVIRDWKPAHPFNPILAEMRRCIGLGADARGMVRVFLNTTSTFLNVSLEPNPWLDNALSIGSVIPEQVDHARRVLEKLAALTGDEC